MNGTVINVAILSNNSAQFCLATCIDLSVEDVPALTRVNLTLFVFYSKFLSSPL